MKTNEEIEREEKEGEKTLLEEATAVEIVVIILLLIMAGILIYMNCQPIHP